MLAPEGNEFRIGLAKSPDTGRFQEVGGVGVRAPGITEATWIRRRVDQGCRAAR
jgi:hypothetical protein